MSDNAMASEAIGKVSVLGTRASCLLAALFAIAALLITCETPAGAAQPAARAGRQLPPGQRSHFAGRVEIPGGRKIFLECRGKGGPTVILVSGFGNAGDVWSQLDPGVTGPSVLAGIGRFAHVCTYDRPNTILQPDGRSRSDPVPQPRTARDLVSELHTLLRAAEVPGPYVMAGHSLGGLLVRLYASTYPGQVSGLVEVDAAYELWRELFTPEQWAVVAPPYREPMPELDPPLEGVDLNVSFDQMLRARTARPLPATLPLVVLSKGLPEVLPPGTILPPGYPSLATVEHVWNRTQFWLSTLLPYARHVTARKSSHYIQNAEPELVIRAVRQELGMLRPARVRCRGGGGSCQARLSLTGGASNKRVVIRLPKRNLRLVSVQPNRSSLRGAYGLSDQRLRAGGSEFAFRLNARESIRRGSDLILRFRENGK